VNPIEEFDDNYELGEMLGQGSTCSVYIGRNKKNGRDVAVKLVQGDPACDDDPLPGHCSTEISALRACSGHPNIVQLEDAYFERRTGRVYIITELLRGGELFDYVVRKGSLSEAEAADIIRDVATALEYMHSMGVIHRDLKPENLLLYRDPPPRTSPDVKIIDFGLSKQLGRGTNFEEKNLNKNTTKPPLPLIDNRKNIQKKSSLGGPSYSSKGSPFSRIPPPPEEKIQANNEASTIVGSLFASSFLGTRGYLAPEMLKRRRYATSVDVWALGVIAFVLLCGCLPFDDDLDLINSPAASRKFKLRFPSWASSLSPLAKDFLAQLLHVDPRIRPTAAKVVSHAWLRPDAHLPHRMLQSPALIKAAVNSSGQSSKKQTPPWANMPEPPFPQQEQRRPPRRSPGSFT